MFEAKTEAVDLNLQIPIRVASRAISGDPIDNVLHRGPDLQAIGGGKCTTPQPCASINHGLGAAICPAEVEASLLVGILNDVGGTAIVVDLVRVAQMFNSITDQTSQPHGADAFTRDDDVVIIHIPGASELGIGGP